MSSRGRLFWAPEKGMARCQSAEGVPWWLDDNTELRNAPEGRRGSVETEQHDDGGILHVEML